MQLSDTCILSIIDAINSKPREIYVLVFEM